MPPKKKKKNKTQQQVNKVSNNKTESKSVSKNVSTTKKKSNKDIGMKKSATTKVDSNSVSENHTSSKLVPVTRTSKKRDKNDFRNSIRNSAHYVYVFGGIVSFLLILSILTALFLYSLINNNLVGLNQSQAFNGYDQIKRTIRSEIIELERNNQDKLDNTMVETINFISLLSNSNQSDGIRQEIERSNIVIVDVKNDALIEELENLQNLIRENHPFLIELGEANFIKDNTFSRNLLFTNNRNQLALIKVIFELDDKNDIVYWKIDPKIRNYNAIEYNVIKKTFSVIK